MLAPRPPPSPVAPISMPGSPSAQDLLSRYEPTTPMSSVLEHTVKVPALWLPPSTPKLAPMSARSPRPLAIALMAPPRVSSMSRPTGAAHRQAASAYVATDAHAHGDTAFYCEFLKHLSQAPAPALGLSTAS
jgi:hypothetical protein